MLSQWNNYEHIKIDSAMMKFDDEKDLGKGVRFVPLEIFTFSCLLEVDSASTDDRDETPLLLQLH